MHSGDNTYLKGVVLAPGIGRGPIWLPPTSSVQQEGTLADLRAAVATLIEESELLPEELGIAYQGLASDPAWETEVSTRLAHGLPLSQAVLETGEVLAAPLRTLDDHYLRARADDLVQIAHQLVRILAGKAITPPEGAVLFAHTVSPVELQIWAAYLGGIVLHDLSPTAHLAIVARGLGLPALAISGKVVVRSMQEALLNAFEGWLELDPPPQHIKEFPPKRFKLTPDAAPVLVAGRRIRVLANVNRPDEALWASRLGADGIGLLRTEFIYAGRSEPPSLDAERALYAGIAKAFVGKPIVARTLDIGGDKPLPYLQTAGQDQGMLGVRGLRLLLRHKDLFKTHLRALLEGFGDSDFALMFPMVATPEEFAEARDLVLSLEPNPPRLGLMLEIPAASYALDVFKQEGASFISLGTNDLMQYFYAASRLSVELGYLQDPKLPAFLAFVEETIRRAKRAGLEIGVCGESAADARLTRFWVQTGADELSLAPGLIPWIKQRLREVETTDEHQLKA